MLISVSFVNPLVGRKQNEKSSYSSVVRYCASHSRQSISVFLNCPQFQRIAVPNEETAIVMAKAVLGDDVEPHYYPSAGYSDWTFDVTL